MKHDAATQNIPSHTFAHTTPTGAIFVGIVNFLVLYHRLLNEDQEIEEALADEPAVKRIAKLPPQQVRVALLAERRAAERATRVRSPFPPFRVQSSVDGPSRCEAGASGVHTPPPKKKTKHTYTHTHTHTISFSGPGSCALTPWAQVALCSVILIHLALFDSEMLLGAQNTCIRTRINFFDLAAGVGVGEDAVPGGAAGRAARRGPQDARLLPVETRPRHHREGHEGQGQCEGRGQGQ